LDVQRSGVIPEEHLPCPAYDDNSPFLGHLVDNLPYNPDVIQVLLSRWCYSEQVELIDYSERYFGCSSANGGFVDNIAPCQTEFHLFGNIFGYLKSQAAELSRDGNDIHKSHPLVGAGQPPVIFIIAWGISQILFIQFNIGLFFSGQRGIIPKKALCLTMAKRFHHPINFEVKPLNQRLKYPYEFIGEILITQDQIEERVSEIGAQITEDYRDSEKLLLLGLLRGSVMFMTDLMRSIRRPMTMDFMLVSSYAGEESSGFVRIDSDHKSSIAGWDVIIVDDIVDSGTTLYTIRKLLLDRKPNSLKVCTLLDKNARHRVEIPIDYCGFEIPDYFVVGYGLDIDEKGRNLPYIASVDLDKYHQLYG